MTKLMDRFESELENCKFNIFEIKGFQVQPKLAILAGIAIGYKLACEDIKKEIN